MLELIKEHFSVFFEPEVIEEIAKVATVREVEKGTQLMSIGQYIRSMPLLINGVIKFMKEDDEGNEYLLYFLERGDTCAMSMTCCLGDAKSEIKAVAETDCSVVMVPVHKMEEWLRFKSWRKFVFESYNDRLSEMLDAIDGLVFLNLKDRLYKYLKDKVMVTGDTMLQVTHQDIATDLNTSRVVVSRLLKQLENETRIDLHRNKLEVLDF